MLISFDPSLVISGSDSGSGSVSVSGSGSSTCICCTGEGSVGSAGKSQFDDVGSFIPSCPKREAICASGSGVLCLSISSVEKSSGPKVRKGFSSMLLVKADWVRSVVVRGSELSDE